MTSLFKQISRIIKKHNRIVCLFLGMPWTLPLLINTSRSKQNGRHFADDIFKCIFLNENVWISIKILLKFVPEGPINNIPAFV